MGLKSAILIQCVAALIRYMYKCKNYVQPKLNWRANLGLQKICLLERPARTNSRVQNTVAQPLIKVVPHVSEGSENIKPSLGGGGETHNSSTQSHGGGGTAQGPGALV